MRDSGKAGEEKKKTTHPHFLLLLNINMKLHFENELPWNWHETCESIKCGIIVHSLNAVGCLKPIFLQKIQEKNPINSKKSAEN